MEVDKKNKVIVVVIASTATKLGAAASIKKVHNHSAQAYMHHDANTHPLWTKYTSYWKELVTYGYSSDFKNTSTLTVTCFLIPYPPFSLVLDLPLALVVRFAVK